MYNILYKKKEIVDKNPKLRTEDDKKMLKSLSYKIRIDTSTKLMDIFKKLGVKSAFKCVTHNLDGQLDYVLMRNDIQSNKYLAGTFKNLYIDHRSLFLRIPTDNNVIPFSPPIHDNT